MCGIVGLFDLDGRRPIDRAMLLRMNDSLAHRGPDGDGLFLQPGVGLGHRRLAIIDLAGGRQPLFNEDGSVVVTFNGEIYNFAELAAELARRGHRFRTHSDTEVIVHAWEEWGAACVDRFRGMFAFALYDANQETLFLARDRLGKKPLYYTILPDGLLLFASELKALLVHPKVVRRFDFPAVEEYFALGYVPEPRSIYAGIAKLPSAHWLKLRRGAAAVEPTPYWWPSFAARKAANEREVCDDLVARLRDAVTVRLVADVPLGAFLSGGVDSSGVVAMMAQANGSAINTFSVAFAESEFDESRYAAEVAGRYRTSHSAHRIELGGIDLVERLATIYDEPFADSSALPTYRICAAARRDVTVALSGDGGDELFAGYRRYRWHRFQERLRARLPQRIRGPVCGSLARLYPQLDRAPRPLRARSMLAELALDSVEGYFHNVCLIKDGLRQRLYSAGLRAELQGYRAAELIARHMQAADSDDPVAQAQYADLKTYLPGDILTKVDRASMATSLEVRAPLLDHRFVEWAAGLPAACKLGGGRGKYILKRALEPYLPSAVLYRPKQGFSIPLAAWLRGPLRERAQAAITGPVVADSGLFDRTFLIRLFEEHQGGGRDHSAVLWSLLSFESFLRQVHDGGQPIQ